MLDGISIVSLTAPTLLGVAVLMLLSGKLVPRVTLLDKTAEADRWRLAYEAEREARQTSDTQTAELLETAKTNHALISAIFRNSEEIRQSGGSGVSSTG